MSDSLKHAVRAAVLRLLHPLVKLLLEAGMGVGDFTSLVKLAYVRAAREQGRESGGEIQRPNVSRIAVVTGLTRVEVAAILAAGDEELSGSDRGRQRAQRVLSGWWNDPGFQDAAGRPATLPIHGNRRSFAALVRRYSGDRRPAPVLDELMRVHAVRRLPEDCVEAVSRTYATVRWDPEGIATLGDQVADHCASLLYNLKNPSHPRFARRVLNTRLDPRYAPVLLRDLERQATTFTNSVDDSLNDPLHCVRTSGGSAESIRLGLGIYVFEGSGEPPPIPTAAPRRTPDNRPRRRTRKKN